jgi:hypothetical protein
MRKSVMATMLWLTSLAMLVCILSAQVSPVLSQSNAEKVVALLHGTGDDVFPITQSSGFLVARIHGNPESRYFAVKTYDQFGNLVSLLVNTTDRYIGIVPFNFDAFKIHDLNGGLLEVSAEGDWSIEIIELYSLAQVQNAQAMGGYGDYVGYVKGSSRIASVYGNKELRYFSVSAIGMNGNSGQGSLLVNTTSLYNGNVRLPSNKDGIVFIVKVAGGWGISFDTSDLSNLFDTRIVTFKTNPYSPFKDIIDESMATPNSVVTPSPTPKTNTAVAPTEATGVFSGVVNRDANLRAGPGTNYAIVSGAKAGQQVIVIASNAANDWYQLDTGQWIAAFLINDIIATNVPTVADSTTAVKTTTTEVSPATTLTPSTPVPSVQDRKPVYWADAGVQTCGNFEWRVSDVRRSKDTWYYDKHQVAQGEYLIIYVEVKNLGDNDDLFWGVNPSMPGKAVSERGSQYAAWMMTGGFNTLWSDIAPGKILTLVGAFDVTPDTHTYLFGALSCEQTVAIGSWFELERGPIKASN